MHLVNYKKEVNKIYDRIAGGLVNFEYAKILNSPFINENTKIKESLFNHTRGLHIKILSEWAYHNSAFVNEALTSFENETYSNLLANAFMLSFYKKHFKDFIVYYALKKYVDYENFYNVFIGELYAYCDFIDENTTYRELKTMVKFIFREDRKI